MSDVMRPVRKTTCCPWCGKNHDRATGVTGSPVPKNGDLSLCIGCGEWAVFDDKWTAGTRKPTSAEFEYIADDDHCRRIRAAFVATRPKPKEGDHVR